MTPSPAERDELFKGFARALFKGDMNALYKVVTPDFLWNFHDGLCQSAFKFDPASASNFDPFERRVLVVALAPSELAGVAETVRARVA